MKKVSKRGNMYQFVSHTFNAIKGICEHDCSYCYMKPKKNLSAIRLDEKEFKTKLEDGNFIFIGSGTDMFASNVPSEWITKTLDYCNDSDNRFLFQSKNPRRILEFIEHPIFKKSVICTTIETNRDYPEEMGNAPKIEERVSAMEEISKLGFETYVTIEPIMEFDLEELVELIKRCNPKQVNIGANSYYKLVQLPEPTKEEILSLIERLSEFTTVEEKTTLNRLTKNSMKTELAQIKNTTVTSISMKVQIMEETEDGCISPKYENRKFALIRENRPILDKNVYYFLQTIRSGKYNRRMPIIAIEASELIDKCNIVDFEGNPISEENTAEYLVIIDGQHRIKAFSLINAANRKIGKEEILIPNVQIEKGIENVSEYLVDINTAGHDWTLADKYCVSAITSESKTIQKTHELIKKGFNPSAAVMLCAGRKITSTQLEKLLKEGDVSFLSIEKEEELLERAEQFFITGMSIEKMNVKMLSKRYFVNGFTSFASSRTTEEAIAALEHLTFEDFKEIRQELEFVGKLKDALVNELVA